MNKPSPFYLALLTVLAFGVILPAQAQKQIAKKSTGPQNTTVEVRQYVQGEKVFNLHDLFRFKGGERVIHSATLVFDRVYGDSSADLVLNGVTVAKLARIARTNREGTAALALPFKVVGGPDLNAQLRLKGDLALRQITLVQSGLAASALPGDYREPLPGYSSTPGTTVVPDSTTSAPIYPGTTVPGSPKPPVTVIRNITNCTDRLFSTKATRWATRSATSFLESPQKDGTRGKGAVDGWDFPELSGTVDGRDAVLQPGYKNALSLFPDLIMNQDFDRLKDLRLEIVGEGDAMIAIALAPFKDGPARAIRLSRRGAVLDVRGLNLAKNDLKHMELTLRSNTGLRVDGIRAIATLEKCTVTQTRVVKQPKNIYLRGGNTKKK